MSYSLFRKSLTFISPFAYPLLSGLEISGPGGAERQFFLFGKRLIERDWKVSFIADKSKGNEDTELTIFPVYHASFSYLGGSKTRVLLDWLSFWQAMKRANSAFYVIKTSAHLMLPASLFCRVYRRKLVFWAQTSHDSRSLRYGINRLASKMQDWGLRRADIVIAQTEEQKREFSNNFRSHTYVVPSICDSLESNSNKDLNSDLIKKEIDILWVGNPSLNKRQEIFFELAKCLRHRTFAIAMNNSHHQRFKEAKNKAVKLDNVFFLGALPPVEMESWFKKAKVLINTSIREGLPNSFLQAWMNGVPVVSVLVDPDNVIYSNGLGYISQSDPKFSIKNSDFKGIASYVARPVEELLTDKKRRIEIGKRAIDYVKKNHAPEVAVAKLLDILEAAHR